MKYLLDVTASSEVPVRTAACLIIGFLCGITCCFVSPGIASAVGWDSDDFLIGGGTNQGGRLGVFDHDLAFKGYLFPPPVTFGNEDFDAAGNVVGLSGPNRVLVYNPSGALVGGFVRSDNALSGQRALRVAPNGHFLVAEQPNFGFGGVLEFSTDGTLLRQYASGGFANSLAVVPGNRAWAWFPSDGADVVRVLDLAAFDQVGTITLSGIAPNFMRLSPSTNTVLIGSIQARAAIEADLNGQIIRRFDLPPNIFQVGQVTRGPAGDVFATSEDSTQLLSHWRADGTFVGTFSVSQTIGNPASIQWAGEVPEPAGALTLGAIGVMGATLVTRSRLHRP